ncbi:MAG: signal peptidase I [Alteromonas naphthalenivorans]|jgi:signal peptidase I
MIQRIRNFITWWNRPDKSFIADWVQSLIVILPIVFVIRTWGYGLYQVPSGSMETTMLVGESYVADKFTYLFKKPKRGEIISFDQPDYPYSKDPIKNWMQHYVFILWGPQNWTKRVIGIPGDHIQGKIEDDKTVVYLNDKKLDEPYLNKYPLVPTTMKLSASGWKSYDKSYSYYDQPFYRMNGHIVKAAQKMWETHGIPKEQSPGMPLDNVSKGSDVYDFHLKDGQYWVMGDNRLGSYDCRGWGKPLQGSFIRGRIVFRLFSIDVQGDSIIWDLLTHPLSFWGRIRLSRFFTIMK